MPLNRFLGRSAERAPLFLVLLMVLAVVVLLMAPARASATDLSVTAASVVRVSGDVETGTAGEVLTAGQAVYRKAADSKWYKADCNSATAEVRVASAIALNGGASGQPVVVQKNGTITLGATLTAGTVYYLSGGAGGIRPAADNTTGDYPQTVGIAISSSVLLLGFNLRSGSAL